jgi:hypothetical protein
MDEIKLIGYKVRTLIYVNVFPNFIAIVTYYYWCAEEQNKYWIQVHLYWCRKKNVPKWNIIWTITLLSSVLLYMDTTQPLKLESNRTQCKTNNTFGQILLDLVWSDAFKGLQVSPHLRHWFEIVKWTLLLHL